MKLEYAFFQQLPSWSQAEVLRKEGTLLARRRHQDWEVVLYSLHNRFVELWVKQGVQVPATFHPSANTLDILEPYTAAIDVQDLIDL